jgi:hypothetical protein
VCVFKAGDDLEEAFKRECLADLKEAFKGEYPGIPDTNGKPFKVEDADIRGTKDGDMRGTNAKPFKEEYDIPGTNGKGTNGKGTSGKAFKGEYPRISDANGRNKEAFEGPDTNGKAFGGGYGDIPGNKGIDDDADGGEPTALDCLLLDFELWKQEVEMRSGFLSRHPWAQPFDELPLEAKELYNKLKLGLEESLRARAEVFPAVPFSSWSSSESLANQVNMLYILYYILHTHTHTHAHTHARTHTYICYICYIHIIMCVCVCIYVCMYVVVFLLRLWRTSSRRSPTAKHRIRKGLLSRRPAMTRQRRWRRRRTYLERA